MKLLNILTIAAVSAVALTSCDKDDDNNDDNNNNSNATSFKVRMTDAPGNFMAMNTQITNVDAMIDGEWVALSSESQMVSVLTLTNGEEEVIAFDGTAQQGHYTQLRIVFGTDNNITINDENGQQEHDLGFAIGVSNTIIVDIDEQVNAGEQDEVLLDFNAANSVTSNIAGWWMDPDINWIEDENTGVRGDLNGAIQAAVKFTGENGEEYWTMVNSQGQFMIRGMESGTYDMVIEGMAATGAALETMQQDNVVVTDGAITNMGAIQFN